MKQCTKCLQSKPLSEFYKASRLNDGHRPDCKGCHIAVKKAGYPKRNAWRPAYRATFAGMKSERESKWRMQGINLSFERYNTLSELQGHVCAICGEGCIKYGKPSPLFVDHDHTTGKVRGLLCSSCNWKLGRVEKVGFGGSHRMSTEKASRAFIYLLSATLRNGFITHPTKKERELSACVNPVRF